MRIGQLAQQTGVSDWSLRYYEKKGLIFGERMKNGYRDFDEEQAERVGAIRCFLKLGMSTGQIGSLLDFDAKDPLSLYEEKLREIDEQIEALHRSKRCLEERISPLREEKAHPLSG